MSPEGMITVISGPSGSGKNSVIKLAAAENSALSYATSATTREMRAGEAEGVDYYYKTHREFDRLISAGDIIEWDEFLGNRYGTLKSEIASKLGAGKNLILDLTIAGALSLKNTFPEQTVTVFLLPPSIEELERRLKSRNRENDAQIRERILWAVTKEIPQAEKFDYVVINGKLDRAKDELLNIINAERLRYSRNRDILERLGLVEANVAKMKGEIQ